MEKQITKQDVPKRILHFGVYLKNSPKLQISRENYAIIDKKNHIGNESYQQRCLPPEVRVKVYADEECTTYTDEWCQMHREACLKNFDLNMQYMSNLSSEEFDVALGKILHRRRKKLLQIFDLNECEGMEGVYVMVLDQYKQAYIGQSTNIKRRIMQHWSKTHPFDRLIFGRVGTSILSINSFGALDTTRIYVYPTTDIFGEEARLVKVVDKRFLLNRTAGGIGKDGDDMVKAEIVGGMKRRYFSSV